MHDAPHAAFGQLLISLRQKAGIANQTEFAGLVNSRQQTVSRWEAGLSRPRDKQMPLIAAVLKADVNELLAAAGFARKVAVATFDQPFPIDSLLPESFERFCAGFLQSNYPEAEVHRAGKTGHTQDGIDIDVRLPDGTIYTFQCKRVDEFGPQKVRAAVAAQTIPAAKKFLLLSRVASPQARAAVREFPDWDIWDKEDVSLKVRRLPKIDQLRLVDTFFKGQRFALLGENEAGPWETTKEFFAPFENSQGLFNHAWKIVGRDDALSALSKVLDNDQIQVVFLVGPGGSGKSRILKQTIEQFEARHKGIVVRFLSKHGEVTKKALEDLGVRDALLVVDDAHDRTDLNLLFQHLAGSPNKVRLVLAARPYGLDLIKAQASGFSLVGPLTSDVTLEPLRLGDAEKLATQVLQASNGPLGAAKDIARLTLDCPLATVVGAQIVAKEKVLFDLAKNEESFRYTLFGRFQNVIAGELGTKADAEPIKKLLKVLALVQPFRPDDTDLLNAIEQVEGVSVPESNRLIKLLNSAGILFKRGARYRLSPDVLADYIVEAHCVGHDGRSTGYAEQVMDAITPSLVENLLVNLGRLDWRLSNGDASNSELMNGVWGKLNPTSEYSDPYLKAVQSVAYYQPAKALEFAERMMREGKFLNQLAEIIKYAAYNYEYVTRACEDLWHLGKDDRRLLNSNPDHPIRILAELCEPQPNKPIDYNEKIIEFGLSLLDKPAEWQHAHSPLEVITPIFKTEGHTTTSHRHTMTFRAFLIDAKVVAALRTRVIDAVVGLFSNSNPRIAVLAAHEIAHALRYPMGLFNMKVTTKERDKWTNDIVVTLEKIDHAIKSGGLDELTILALARSISWHANYSTGKTTNVAKRIQRNLPTSLDFRVLVTLVDGYGTEFRRFNPDNHEAAWKKYVKNLTEEILAAYPDGEEARAFIAKKIDHHRKYDPERSGSPYVLFSNLLISAPAVARATVEDAVSHPDSATARFASNALAALWRGDVEEGRRLVARFLKSGRPDLLASIAHAYVQLPYKEGRHGDDEISTLRILLASNVESVVRNAIYALRSLAESAPDTALRLFPLTNIGTSAERADELVCLFTWGRLIPFDRLSEDDVNIILAKLMLVPELEGHWIEVFLAEASAKHPASVLAFFLNRVQRAAETLDWHYRPINHGPYGNVPLRFKESSDYGSLLAVVVNWMKAARYDKEKQSLFNYRARELFEAVFGSFDGEVVRFLDEWSERAEDADFRMIADIVGEAPRNFVFAQQAFVSRLLGRATKAASARTRDYLIGSLSASASNGMKQGVAGEPFPEDIALRENAGKVLKSLSRFSPEYELYEGLLKDADRNIERTRERDETLED